MNSDQFCEMFHNWRYPIYALSGLTGLALALGAASCDKKLMERNQHKKQIAESTKKDISVIGAALYNKAGLPSPSIDNLEQFAHELGYSNAVSRNTEFLADIDGKNATFYLVNGSTRHQLDWVKICAYLVKTNHSSTNNSLGERR
jgi:hypothetical protein